MTDIARDVTDAEFKTAVIDRSHQIPVVVDLWAPWCGPCRQLGPILEKVAADRTGEFELVKINVDENPVSAQQLGARSIPLVIAFRDGAIVNQFVGAKPQSAVMEFINSIAPSKADRLVTAAADAIASGEADGAEQLLNEALQADRQHRNARLNLAQLLVSQQRHDEALDSLQALPTKPNDPVSRLIAEIRTRMFGGGDLATLERHVNENPTDLGAAISLGKALGAERQFQRALEVLLATIRTNPAYNEGEARQSVIDLLAVMGPNDPLTREYRQKLARAIH